MTSHKPRPIQEACFQEADAIGQNCEYHREEWQEKSQNF